MSLEQSGLSLEVIWVDEHAVEFRVRASNGRFAAVADLYGRHDEPAQLAEVLRGFPTSSTDSRDFQLGTFDPRAAGGGVRIALRGWDKLGHSVATVEVQGDRNDALGPQETAVFSFRVEAAGIDAFVAQLCSMQRVVGARAALASTDGGSFHQPRDR